MAISFPGSKSNGQKFTAGNKSWTWNGSSWKGTTSNGGDATSLGGTSATSFLRSDANDTFTGNLTTGANNYITFGPNSSWSSYLRVGGNGRTVSGTTSASVVTTNGNLHLDSGTDKGIFLNYYAGTAGVAFGNGSTGVVAVMGTDGDLWKGSSDNSGSKYWHAGNDGPGSGLDADTVDGLQASSFLRSDASDTFTGSTLALGNYGSASMNLNFQVSQNGASNINFYDNNGTEGLFIHTENLNYGGKIHFGPRWNTDENAVTFHMLKTSAGGTHNGARVGIGTTSPGHKLDVVGGSIRINDVGQFIHFGTNASVKIGTASGNSNDLYLGSADDLNMESSYIRLWRGGYYGSTEYGRLAFSDDSWLCTGGSSHYLGIGTNNPTERLHVSGNILATGNITANSDISLKDNITPIPNALDKVLQIRGVTFNRNDIEDNPRHAGVIAQEVEKVLPEVVSEGEDGIKSVAYGNMVSLLIEAIKEQQEQIDMLKEKLESK